MSLVIITINYNTIECATQIFFNIEMFISAKVHSKPFKTYRSYKQLNEEKFFCNFAVLMLCLYMYVHLANASNVVLCYMSCLCIYIFLNVCVTVFMSAKSSTELMFVMLHCKPDLK